MANKFGAKKTTVDNIIFASKAEATRYQELKLLLTAGVIADLTLQPKFLLQEGFVDRYDKRQRPIWYVGDFQYQEAGQTVVEEVKGFETAVWRLKKKMVLYRYPLIDLRIIK